MPPGPARSPRPPRSAGSPGKAPGDERAETARVYRYLVRQGFGADDVSAALRRRRSQMKDA